MLFNSDLELFLECVLNVYPSSRKVNNKQQSLNFSHVRVAICNSDHFHRIYFQSIPVRRNLTLNFLSTVQYCANYREFINFTALRVDNIPSVHHGELFLWYGAYYMRDDGQRFSRQRSKCRYITRRVIRPFYFETSIEAGKLINVMMACFKILAEQ